MIILHRLNGKEFVVNSAMIKFVEAIPDTLVTLDVHGGKDEKIIVQESVDQVIKLILDFERKCAPDFNVRMEQ